LLVESLIRLDDVRRAWEAQDPDLPRLVLTLAAAPDAGPKTPLREGAPTLSGLLAELKSREFRRKSREEQLHRRTAGLQALEAETAEAPLPERFRLSGLLLELWHKNGPYERRCLLEVIAEAPLRWGPWRALKRIFKEAEERGDTEVYGALAARFDAALSKGRPDGEVSILTLGYLCRRAWRFLRRTASSLPATYADAACEVLRFYPDQTQWSDTWIANHIFAHETHQYKRQRFRLRRGRTQSLLKDRAYPELWKRTPRPLFTLVERARTELVRRFACEALRTDFRSQLREVEPAWAARLVGVRSATVDEFFVWLLGNVPRFEQGAFRKLGLHEAVLGLFDSPSDEGRTYAAAYARTHARDLPLDELVRLANNSHEAVRTLARDLLQDRDPRTEVGLEGWGRLLGTPHAHELAAAAIRKHFGARELSPEWFAARLLSDHDRVVEFAIELLPKIHLPRSLDANFFRGLLDDARVGSRAALFALEALAGHELGELDADFWRRSLLHPHTSRTVRGWIEQERLHAETLGTDFWKALAYRPDWEASAWVHELRSSGRPWAKDLQWDEMLSKLAVQMLGDVRKFSPQDLQFEWLMRLVERSEPEYHEFAVETMIKAFVPADFAPAEAAPEAKPTGGAAAAPGAIDLGGQSFLFTGTLKSMTRTEAEQKVTEAGGANASGVTAKLHYLVIGDEGSPLYGHGRKGSKQVKAEQLVAKGAPIRIISETAFLQMLAGEQRTFSEDAVQRGCERLWKMATDPGPADAPLRRFALRYLRRHHTGLGPELSDRPVDPGAEVPAEWLSFERVRPAFTDGRAEVRALALDLARWELARWKPPIEAIVELYEAPHPEVRQFLAKALLADAGPEHRLYRIDPASLTPAAVYSFAESLDKATRALGMQLIARDARLAVPPELFRLTESPDRQVRAFVIRSLWSLYRDRGITRDWKPTPPPQPAIGAEKKARKKAAAAESAAQAAPAAEAGGGPPARPAELPAPHLALRSLLRQSLFGIPPARLEKSEAQSTEEEAKKKRLRPLPARKAKLALIEVLRDLGQEDAAFAEVVAPLLEEFMDSRGPSERAACLVALVRLGRGPARRASGTAEETA
jgi:hypothetical protein